MQLHFNPLNTEHFRWVGDWYEYDSKAAQKEALRQRNDRAKEEKAKGNSVKKWTSRDQLCRRGGIGSDHPDVEFWVNVPMLEVY